MGSDVARDLLGEGQKRRVGESSDHDASPAPIEAGGEERLGQKRPRAQHGSTRAAARLTGNARARLHPQRVSQRGNLSAAPSSGAD